MQLQQVTEGMPAFSIDEAAAAFTADALALDFCRKWILQRIHPRGPICPSCGTPVQGDKPLASWWEDRRVCCKGCGAYFSNRSGTFLQGSRIRWSEIFLLAALSGLRIPADQIARATGLHIDTVRHWTRTLDALTKGPA